LTAGHPTVISRSDRPAMPGSSACGNRTRNIASAAAPLAADTAECCPTHTVTVRLWRRSAFIPSRVVGGPAPEKLEDWSLCVSAGDRARAQGRALSRPRRGFESRWGHHARPAAGMSAAARRAVSARMKAYWACQALKLLPLVLRF